MNFILLQSLWSIVILVTFIGIVLWAYSGKRKSAFDEAARLPFDDPPFDDNTPGVDHHSSPGKESLPTKDHRSR